MDAITKGVDIINDVSRGVSQLDRIADNFENIDKLPIAIFGMCIAALIIFFFVRAFVSTIQLHFARKKAYKNPTTENALKVLKLLKRFGVGINNHPKDWGDFRDMFYRVNGSSEIPSELKQRLKDQLVKEGLYISSMRIIDNYKGNAKQETVVNNADAENKKNVKK